MHELAHVGSVMAILIDGYNLLNATGIFGRGTGPPTLERSRDELLNFIADSVDESELSHTTVVFDAKNPPPGLPRTLVRRGVTVYFASQFEEADDLLEELIRTDPTPRKLLVVSSDHRVQRAARRRHARVIDSRTWYDQIVRRRREADETFEDESKPPEPRTPEEVERWLAEFQFSSPPSARASEPDRPTRGECEASPTSSPASKSQGPATEPRDAEAVKRQHDISRAQRELTGEVKNPFPPGYADDVVEEEATDLDDRTDPRS